MLMRDANEDFVFIYALTQKHEIYFILFFSKKKLTFLVT